MAYISLMKDNLPVYGVDAKDLKHYTTTEKDRLKGKSRIPGDEYLLNDENIFDRKTIKEEEAKMSVDEKDWDSENYL